MKNDKTEATLSGKIEDSTSQLVSDVLIKSDESDSSEQSTDTAEGEGNPRMLSGLCIDLFAIISWLDRIFMGDGPLAFLKLAWQGKARLWKVWWLLGSGVMVFKIAMGLLMLHLAKGIGLQLFYLIQIIVDAQVPVMMMKNIGSSNSNGELLVVLQGLLIGVEILFWRMAWDCAPNTHHRFWTSAARNIVLLSVLLNFIFVIGIIRGSPI